MHLQNLQLLPPSSIRHQPPFDVDPYYIRLDADRCSLSPLSAGLSPNARNFPALGAFELTPRQRERPALGAFNIPDEEATLLSVRELDRCQWQATEGGIDRCAPDGNETLCEVPALDSVSFVLTSKPHRVRAVSAPLAPDWFNSCRALQGVTLCAACFPGFTAVRQYRQSVSDVLGVCFPHITWPLRATKQR